MLKITISFMERKPHKYWLSKENCHKEALKFTSRSKFRKAAKGGYNCAWKNKWLDDICSHMEHKEHKVKILVKPKVKKSNKIWTYEKCKEEALKYTTRNSFKLGSGGAYHAVNRNGWREELFAHMIPQGSLKDRYVYSYEFNTNNSVYIGLTWNISIRHTQHLNRNSSSVNKHISKYKLKEDDYILKELGYYPMDIAGQKERDFVKHYREKGWNILNISKAGTLGGGGILTWTYKKCKEEALKYTTRNSFRLGSSGAYASVMTNGWRYELLSHMSLQQTARRYWTKERCQEEALKYDNKTDFRKKSAGSYTKSRKSGWMDEICYHMNLRIKKPFGY